MTNQQKPPKLNDHRLEDGGFVDRLKPTKSYKGKNQFLLAHELRPYRRFFFA